MCLFATHTVSEVALSSRLCDEQKSPHIRALSDAAVEVITHAISASTTTQQQRPWFRNQRASPECGSQGVSEIKVPNKEHALFGILETKTVFKRA